MWILISLQPTFMMFADGLIKIKTKDSAFTGLILKLCFTAVIYYVYVWREKNSRRHEGNPSSKQNVVLENCKGSQTETAFGFLSSQIKLRVMDFLHSVLGSAWSPCSAIYV